MLFRKMSTLGHKPAFRSAIVMSALPPIATAKADSRKRSCPLYPLKADILNGFVGPTLATISAQPCAYLQEIWPSAPAYKECAVSGDLRLRAGWVQW